MLLDDRHVQGRTARPDDIELRERVARLDGLLEQTEAISDADDRSKAVSAIQGLLELYGEGLARLIDRAGELGGREMVDALAEDELISHLLLLHGLHPLEVEERVRRALMAARPTLESHGAEIELLGVQGGVARIRLQGSGTGCSSSEATLKRLIEETILQAAPDVESVQTDAGTALPAGSFVSLECLVSAPRGGAA